MALDKFSDDDLLLGKRLASGTGSAFVQAVMSVDSTGNPVSGTASAAATTPARLLSSAASDNATSAFAAAETLRHVFGKCNRSSDCYLKLYDKATAPASTDTPKLTLPLPAGAGFAFDFPQGVSFTLGLGYRITTGTADNDTGAVAAGDVTAMNIVVA